jgi:predicted enzyme related to lactoylglutathione lyase
MTGNVLLFAGVATADLALALPWYERFMGRPADVRVHAGEVMWQICDGGWIYLVVDPGRAGRALVTVAVPDLDRTVAEMAARGVAPPAIETIEEAGRKATIVDPEGNSIACIEVPARDD